MNRVSKVTRDFAAFVADMRLRHKDRVDILDLQYARGRIALQDYIYALWQMDSADKYDYAGENQEA